MKLEDITAKLKDAEIDSAVIDAVKALDQSAEIKRLEGELEAEHGKSAGILEDKKKYKERAEKAESELSDIEKSKLPEKERYEREKAELQEKLEQEKAERERQQQDFAKTQREAKLADLTGSIRWAEGTPHDTAKLIISQALSGVEDLADQKKVDEVLGTVKESHKSFIAAEAPAGAGAKGGSGGTNVKSSEPASMMDLVSEAWKTN